MSASSGQAPTVRVAAAQFRSTRDPAENLLAVERWARRAADHGSQLLVCPEATMVNFATKLAPFAEPLDGPFVTRLRQIATDSALWLVAGVFEPSGDGRVFNTAVATNGQELHAYRKINLYDAHSSQESRTVAPGQELVTFNALGTTIGLSTCFDVRVAEQFVALRRAGAKLLCVPASWQDGPAKVEQWSLLIRSRAMDAQAFLVTADQSANPARDDGGRPLGAGHSMVAGPLGEVVAELGGEDGLLAAEVDLAEVDRARQLVPLR